MKNMLLIACFILIITACNLNKDQHGSQVFGRISSEPNSTDTAKNLHGAYNVRGTRYCEILVVKGGLANLTATVYNTLGCNDCPNDKGTAVVPTN